MSLKVNGCEMEWAGYVFGVEYDNECVEQMGSQGQAEVAAHDARVNGQHAVVVFRALYAEKQWSPVI